MQTTKWVIIVVAATLAFCACDKKEAEPSPPLAHEHVGDDHVHVHDHAAHQMPADAPLPGDSLYHASLQLTDQHGQPLELGSLKGSPVLATMFYASCRSVCPILIDRLQRVVAALPEDVRAQTHVLLVSLDPERDTPEALKELAERHKIADPHWHFVRTDPAGVREISALLGVRYRKLPDGEFSHSPLIALLDKHGAIQERMLDAADEAQLIAATTKAARPRE